MRTYLEASSARAQQVYIVGAQRYGEGPALSRFEVNRDRELSEGKATSGRGFDREGGEEAYGQSGRGDRLDLQPSSTSTTSRTYTATMTHGRSGANVKHTVAEREQRAGARDGRGAAGRGQREVRL